MRIEIRTPYYDPQRFSPPLIARVTFDWAGIANYEFGQFITNFPGLFGLLVIDALDNSIIYTRQIDHRGHKSKHYWYIVRDKKLVKLKNKTEAYKASLL